MAGNDVIGAEFGKGRRVLGSAIGVAYTQPTRVPVYRGLKCTAGNAIGLAGLGDLALTCTGDLSQSNACFGKKICRMHTRVRLTSLSLYKLSDEGNMPLNRMAAELPILEAVLPTRDNSICWDFFFAMRAKSEHLIFYLVANCSFLWIWPILFWVADHEPRQRAYPSDRAVRRQVVEMYLLIGLIGECVIDSLAPVCQVSFRQLSALHVHCNIYFTPFLKLVYIKQKKLKVTIVHLFQFVLIWSSMIWILNI